MAKLPIITAFQDSPDRGQGLARDTIVRWALEEVGQAYDVRLVPFKQIKDPNHRKVHPFGKIPTYEDGDLTLFESGAIVLHVADNHKGLFPEDENARERAIMWMFASQSTIEPPIVELAAAFLLEKNKTWYEERLVMLKDNVRLRLKELSVFLGARDWLEGEFSAGDLLMISVMRRLGKSGLLLEFPNLLSYVERGEARPAFKKAFAAQLAVYEASQNKKA